MSALGAVLMGLILIFVGGWNVKVLTMGVRDWFDPTLRPLIAVAVTLNLLALAIAVYGFYAVINYL